jgi:hypothetical protein
MKITKIENNLTKNEIYSRTIVRGREWLFTLDNVNLRVHNSFGKWFWWIDRFAPTTKSFEAKNLKQAVKFARAELQNIVAMEKAVTEQEDKDFAADMREAFEVDQVDCEEDFEGDYRIDKFYDRSTKLWIITIKDNKTNFQVGDAEFAAAGDKEAIKTAVEYLDSEIIKLCMMSDYER